MYRFLLTPRWLGALAGALAVAALCVLLGSWQWDRREQARARNEPVAANYDSAPVPVTEALATSVADGRLDPRAEWTPVTARGQYRAEDTVLVRNRTLAGRPGYHVLVPLDLGDGTALLVNRGFVPTGATGLEPDVVPAPPAGQVEVTARLRAPEPASERAAPEGQAHRIDTAAIDEQVALRLLRPTYGVLAAERPAPDAAPVALPRPQIDEGPHLSYSLQWFVFAAGILVAYGVIARRTARADVAPPVGPQRRRRSAEQEEDALLDAAESRQPLG